MTDKKYMLVVIMVLAGLCFGFIRTAASGEWERTCYGRVELSKTAGAWSVVCKPGSGAAIIRDEATDPTPWPRDATTEAIFRATWTPEPYPPVPVYP